MWNNCTYLNSNNNFSILKHVQRNVSFWNNTQQEGKQIICFSQMNKNHTQQKKSTRISHQIWNKIGWKRWLRTNRCHIAIFHYAIFMLMLNRYNLNIWPYHYIISDVSFNVIYSCSDIIQHHINPPLFNKVVGLV